MYGTWVDGMSPTDHNFTISTKVALGKMPLPFFDSGSTYKVTIWGARFGDSAEDSSLTMRPIAMPFALDASAIACVETDTIPTNRPKTCKEFKYTSDDYDGGASAYCSGGSEIDSAHIEDYYPTSISKYIEVREGITTIKSFAVFEFSKVLLEHSARFMVCWRMSRKDHYHFPWATIGHIDARTRNMGINGIIAWDVWVTHTFGMYGAYIISVEPQPEIIANRPFKLTMVGRGVGCDPLNPKYRVKLAIGNGIQALVGGTVGGGCDSGSSSESVGSVIGGDAVIPTCRQDLTNGNEVVVETEFTVMVEAVTKLELCWSSTAGNPFFKNAFYVGGAVFVTLEAKPWYVRQFLINNQPIETAAKLMAHQPFSLTILGEGLQKTGAVNLQVSLAVDCLDSDTVVPGGDWRTVDCIFSHQSATVEFNIFSPVKGVQICLQRSTQKLIWTPFLERSRYYCTPEYCGAPRCAPATNYLFDDFGCDEVCCEKACLNDPYCNYWQRYDIPGRVFRRCQTMAHCKNPSLLMLFDRSPIISQKTFGTGRETYAAGTIPDVLGPVVFDVTPQVNPPLRARVPFVVKVQGTGLVPAHVQIHVKVANTQIGCNDMKALNKTMAAWNEIALEREAVFSQLEAAKNFSYNGTCGGGNSNCEGGPAPPGTTCFFDVNCQSPAAPGGKCIPPNTGTSCLKDEHCTFNGFCNNSLYNLSMTPPPEPPPMQIPFQEVSDAGTLLGGTGRFLKVDNFSYGVTTFQIDEAGKGVLCYAIRNPQEEQNLVSENGQFIKDLSLIQAMSSYIETREFEILMPQIL